MNLDASSLERLVPDDLDVNDVTGRETLYLHLARYDFAARYALPGRLLDMACGAGYGSRLMSDRRSDICEVLGVDMSVDAIAYASQRYGNERVRFIASDAMTFDERIYFDTIVSLETIEHLPDPDLFVRRVVALLRDGGRFIGSVPTTPSVDANPHHLHDFTERSFREMGTRAGLHELECFRQVQPFSPLKIATRREARLSDMRTNLLGYYLKHPTAALRRALSTIVDGFNNKYITIVWEKA